MNFNVSEILLQSNLGTEIEGLIKQNANQLSFEKLYETITDRMNTPVFKKEHFAFGFTFFLFILCATALLLLYLKIRNFSAIKVTNAASSRVCREATIN